MYPVGSEKMTWKNAGVQSPEGGEMTHWTVRFK